jgi:hypothetical protein
MSGSFGQSKTSSSQQSESKPLTADEVASYFSKLNDLSGGRLTDFATAGTPQLTPEQIQAVGGLGADRTRQLDVARKQAIDQVTADPNLTIDQRQRSTQLTNQDYNDRLTAITKEIEGQKTGLAQYNAGLTKDDLALLANIYFGGKGQTSESSGGSMGRSFNIAGGIGKS